MRAECCQEFRNTALVGTSFAGQGCLLEFEELGLWSHELVVTGGADSATARFRSRLRVRSSSSSMRLVIF